MVAGKLNRSHRRFAVAMWRWIVGAFVVAGCCAPAWGIKVTNEELNFSIAVPDRYIQLPSTSDSMLYLFATSDPREGVPDAIVGVQRLHENLAPGRMDLAATGIPDAHFEKGKWQGLNVDVMAGHVVKNGVAFAGRGAQLPLEGEAIQIVVAVPLEREASADGVLQDFLDGLDGTPSSSNGSNLSSFERGRLVGQGVGQFVVVIALLIGAVVLLMRNSQPSTNAGETGDQQDTGIKG